jgi:hypothetical protein
MRAQRRKSRCKSAHKLRTLYSASSSLAVCARERVKRYTRVGRTPPRGAPFRTARPWSAARTPETGSVHAHVDRAWAATHSCARRTAHKATQKRVERKLRGVTERSQTSELCGSGFVSTAPGGGSGTRSVRRVSKGTKICAKHASNGASQDRTRLTWPAPLACAPRSRRVAITSSPSLVLRHRTARAARSSASQRGAWHGGLEDCCVRAVRQGGDGRDRQVSGARGCGAAGAGTAHRSPQEEFLGEGLDATVLEELRVVRGAAHGAVP